MVLFFFKQKTAYEMRISDGSSDVCSSDLSTGSTTPGRAAQIGPLAALRRRGGLSASMAGMPTTSTDFGFWKEGALLSSSAAASPRRMQLGSAACRERVCQYVSISVVACSLKQTNHEKKRQKATTPI